MGPELLRESTARGGNGEKKDGELFDQMPIARQRVPRSGLKIECKADSGMEPLDCVATRQYLQACGGLRQEVYSSKSGRCCRRRTWGVPLPLRQLGRRISAFKLFTFRRRLIR